MFCWIVLCYVDDGFYWCYVVEVDVFIVVVVGF